MPALLERPKMTKLMYGALKKHIIKERERKKQAEQEQDAILERQKMEREMKKKKEEEHSLTLEQTKDQIQTLEKKLETLKAEKHELFSQLKKVLHQEDESRKRAQLKEQSELLSLQQAYQPIPVSGHSVLLPAGSMSGRPTLYRPAQPMISMAGVGVKRPRSPSPPPTSVYQHQYGENKMLSSSLAVAKQPTAALYTHGHPAQGEFKQGSFPQGQPSQVTYVTQSGHSFQQSTASYSTSKSPAGKYNAPNPVNQSAFSSYPSHYAQHQKQITEPYPGFPLQRMAQPGYLGSQHGTNIPLQQQLEQANQKAGFNEEKYKLQQQQHQLRGVAPLPGQQPALIPHQPIQLQQPSAKGSIVTGYSARAQAPQGTATSSYQPASSQANFPGQQAGTPGRPGYTAQQRYY